MINSFDATADINWTDAFKQLAQAPLPSSWFETQKLPPT